MSEDGRIRYGIHPLLEAEANELIFGSLRGVTSQSAKSDILTPWKENNRREREVLTSGGVVDAQIRKGIYGRAYNTQQTHLNSCDGVTAPARIPKSSHAGNDIGAGVESGWSFR